jgi:hypothetical protein
MDNFHFSFPYFFNTFYYGKSPTRFAEDPKFNCIGNSFLDTDSPSPSPSSSPPKGGEGRVRGRFPNLLNKISRN